MTRESLYSIISIHKYHDVLNREKSGKIGKLSDGPSNHYLFEGPGRPERRKKSENIGKKNVLFLCAGSSLLLH